MINFQNFQYEIKDDFKDKLVFSKDKDDSKRINGKNIFQLSIQNKRLDLHKMYWWKGSSGSGKTTLLNILLGLHSQLPKHAHYLNLKKASLSQMEDHSLFIWDKEWLQTLFPGSLFTKNKQPNIHSLFLSTLRLGYWGVVSQNFHLYDYLTVEEHFYFRIENFFLESTYNGKTIHHLLINKQKCQTEQLSILRQQFLKEVDHLIDVFEIRPFLKRYPSKLSVGQQQRVALIRAWCTLPQFFFADEPTSSLDPKMKKIFFQEIQRLHNQYQMGSLVISHEHPEIFKSVIHNLEVWNFLESYPSPETEEHSSSFFVE